MQPCRCKPSMHGSPPTFLHTNGEAAVAPPWGSSIRRPPKVCRACSIKVTSSSAQATDLSQRAKLQMASSSFLSGSWTPLCFSPQEPGDHRRPCAKKRKSVTFWLCFPIFGSSKLQSKFCIEKTTEKTRKFRFWLFKTLPKLSQNRDFWHMTIFEKSCSRLGEIAIFQVLGFSKPDPNPKKID